MYVLCTVGCVFLHKSSNLEDSKLRSDGLKILFDHAGNLAEAFAQRTSITDTKRTVERAGIAAEK